MKQNIKTIIFDLGGVLVDWNPMYVYRKIFDTEEKAQWFVNNICTLEWNEEHDGGRLIKDGEKLLIAQYPEWESQILLYYKRWEEMLKGSIDGTVDILLQIHQKNEHQLLALTNWSAETFPVALERFDFLQVFEGIVVSGTEKMKKPDPRIYQLILDRYNCVAQECIFIDDNFRNIEGSKALGINSIHFESPEQLLDALKNYNIHL